ncbi:quercetin dioxygenase-like cupin family protein [Sphingomonas sp. UYAg733]
MTAQIVAEAGYPAVMTIRRAGSGVRAGPDGVANGPFTAQTLLSGCAEGEMTAVRASFDPGVATHWHSHPRGQLLFVLGGVGLVQSDGGDVAEVREGDCVWFAADERHWHGAGEHGRFDYISLQAIKNGTAVHWYEPVSDAGAVHRHWGRVSRNG